MKEREPALPRMSVARDGVGADAKPGIRTGQQYFNTLPSGAPRPVDRGSAYRRPMHR